MSNKKDWVDRLVDDIVARNPVEMARLEAAIEKKKKDHKFDVGVLVMVREKRENDWPGEISAPSPLWKDWWLVRPIATRSGRKWRGGKRSSYAVHESEMNPIPSEHHIFQRWMKLNLG